MTGRQVFSLDCRISLFYPVHSSGVEKEQL